MLREHLLCLERLLLRGKQGTPRHETGNQSVDKMDPAVQAAISGMLKTEVAVHVPPSSWVLLVGPGRRTEEIPAVFFCLAPSEVVAFDSGDEFEGGCRKWQDFVNSASWRGRREYRRKVHIENDLEKDFDGVFDILIAFSISPFLQLEHNLKKLAAKSRNLLVITANNQGTLVWTPGGVRISEPEFIDRNLSKLPDFTMIARMKPLGIETTDGHLWILQRKSD